MQRFNIVNPENYTNKQGEEKTKWHRVGELVLFENGGICKLYMFDKEFKVFEQQDRDLPPGVPSKQPRAQEISDDEIPF